MVKKNNFDKINPSFLENILSHHFGVKSSIQSFNFQTLSGGFDAKITDGGLYQFKLVGKIGKKPAPSLVLKIVPSFKSCKQAVINKLHKLDHSAAMLSPRSQHGGSPPQAGRSLDQGT